MPRGVEFDDTHGTNVRVRSSSQAMYDAVWVFMVPRDQDWHQRSALHLNREQAIQLVKALNEWLRVWVDEDPHGELDVCG